MREGIRRFITGVVLLAVSFQSAASLIGSACAAQLPRPGKPRLNPPHVSTGASVWPARAVPPPPNFTPRVFLPTEFAQSQPPLVLGAAGPANLPQMLSRPVAPLNPPLDPRAMSSTSRMLQQIRPRPQSGALQSIRPQPVATASSKPISGVRPQSMLRLMTVDTTGPNSTGINHW